MLLLGTIVAMIVLPPSGPRRAVNYAYMLCVLTMTGGFIWLAMALYFRSHWRVFADLVRDAPLLSGEVEGISRSSRGMEYLHVLCTWPDGSRTRLRAEGQPFSTLCHVEQELPCLCTKGKYSAVLLPNDELALAVTKRLST